jgi:hypothetical protein
MAIKQSAANLALLLFLLAPFADADEPPLTPVPNRPTASTTAESVAAGVFEVEGGVEAADDHASANALLKLGATDHLELWLGGVPFQRVEVLAPTRASGIGDLSVGFKLRALDHKNDVPSLGVLYLAKLPTASESRGLGSGKVDHAITLLVSKDFGKVHVDFNDGIELIGRAVESGFEHDFFTALAMSYSVSARWGLSAEISGFTSAIDGEDGTIALLGAVTYSPSPRMVLDAAVSFGVHGAQPGVTVIVGATYTVGRAFKRAPHEAK